MSDPTTISSNDSDPLSHALTGILAPGSSLNPTFLALLDGAFAFLLVVLLGLAVVTSGNLHIFALMVIELALWASVKWFVNELRNTAPEAASTEQQSNEEVNKNK